MDLWNIQNVRYLFLKYNCKFSKSLGQNFLVDPYVCPKMVKMAGINNNIGVIEIGPGIGVLTVEIAKYAKKWVAIEVDEKLLPILSETLNECNNVKIINQDVLKINLHELIKKEFENMDVIVCANLPYYITSPIIMHLIESKLPIKCVTVMVQKEAAERITALPGTRNVGAISIAVRYYCEPSVLFDVPRESFLPAPEVDSAVIKLKVREKPAVEVESEEIFFKIVKAAFSQRRKTIVNSLFNNFNFSKIEIRKLLNKLNIDEKNRAENLSIENFKDISNEIYNLTCN